MRNLRLGSRRFQGLSLLRLATVLRPLRLRGLGLSLPRCFKKNRQRVFMSSTILQDIGLPCTLPVLQRVQRFSLRFEERCGDL